MTLNYGIFDVSDPQNPDRVYSAALLSRILSKHIRDGIVHGDGNEMAVSASDPPAMTVEVATGTAMVQGRFCENDAALTLPVTTAHATYPRIDRVVVRLNASPGRTIDILVKKGTPAPSPVPPGLTRTPETWELSLAQISVAAGATMVQAANITDERGNASLCGVAAPVYVPSSQVEVVGAINMQSNALTGLPAPSGATDAARKGYVDTEIARAIGGFGISDIAIDADKDWGGKNITNVGQVSADTVYAKLYAAKFSSEASDNVLMTFTTDLLRGDASSVTDLITCTMPSGLQAGSKLRLSATSTLGGGSINIRVLINGTQVYEGGSNYDCTVNPGQVLKLQGLGGLTEWASHKITGQIKGTLLPVIEVPPPNWSQT